MNTDPPIYRAVAADLGHPNGHHHYRDDPPDTEEVLIVGKHSDHDGDGVADQGDPDWLRGVDIGDDPGGFEVEHVYDFPDPQWRPESDFTGEWVDELVSSDEAPS